MKIKTMLWAAVCLMIFAGAISAGADYLILAPTATTLTTGQIRAEAAVRSNDSQQRYYRLGTGLQQLELTATRIERPKLSAETMVGAQWSFLPETVLSPALAFGVSDIASQSSDGIGVYAVITRHLPIGARSTVIKDFAATAGIGMFGIRGPFFGFEAKLPMKMFVQGEYDSRNLNAAIGWQPRKIFRIKGYIIDKDTYVGAELVPLSF